MLIQYSAPANKEKYAKYKAIIVFVAVVPIIAQAVEAATDFYLIEKVLTKAIGSGILSIILSGALVAAFSIGLYASYIAFLRSSTWIGLKGLFALATLLLAGAIFYLSTAGATEAMKDFQTHTPNLIDVAAIDSTKEARVEKLQRQFSKDSLMIADKYSKIESSYAKYAYLKNRATRQAVWNKEATRGQQKEQEAALQDSIAKLAMMQAKEFDELKDKNSFLVLGLNNSFSNEIGKANERNDAEVALASSLNSKKQFAAWLIAAVCLPIFFIFNFLAERLRKECGIVPIIKAEGSADDPIRNLKFAISDAIKARLNNFAVLMHKKLAPRNKREFGDNIQITQNNAFTPPPAASGPPIATNKQRPIGFNIKEEPEEGDIDAMLQELSVLDVSKLMKNNRNWHKRSFEAASAQARIQNAAKTIAAERILKNKGIKTIRSGTSITYEQ